MLMSRETVEKVPLLARLRLSDSELDQMTELLFFTDGLIEQKQCDGEDWGVDNLVKTALQAGALGAKLSGAGRGGNMIALVGDGEMETAVCHALHNAGATAILTTILE